MKKLLLDLDALNVYDAQMLSEVIEDADMNETRFSVIVADPNDGAEIFQAVNEKYGPRVGLKDANFITHQFITLCEVEVTDAK